MVISNGGDYVSSLKEKQRTLHDDVELFFKEELLKEDKKKLEQQGNTLKHLIISMVDMKRENTMYIMM